MEAQEGRRKLDFAFVTEEVFSKDKVPEQPATSQLRFLARQWAKSQDVTVAGFSTPRFLANERWCTTARCTLCEGCYENRGSVYQFSGGWHVSKAFFQLEICKAGECNGAPRRKAGKTSCEDLRPSDSDRLRVHKIADWLLERNFAVTPANVARRMGADRIGREDIRAILKHRRSVEDEKSTKKFRESWEDIQQVAEKFQDPDSGPLFIQEICMEAFTYIAFLPLMLNALQNLLSEAAGEYNSKWAMCADFTHSMCVMGFKYAVICAVVHRRLKGRWRRSFWPLIIACSPVETLLSYEKIFTALRDELQRRRMCMPSQLNVDHFLGSAAAAKNVFGSSLHVTQDLEHMRRAILQNHKKGRRQRWAEPQRRAAAKHQAHARAKRKARRRQATVENAKPPPFLESRPIWAVLPGVQERFFFEWHSNSKV